MARYQPKHLDSTPSAPQKRRRPRRLAHTPRKVPAARLLLLAAAITGAAVLGGTAARYLREWSGGSLATAGNFYFTSAELDGADHRVPAALRPKFTFALHNYAVADHPTAGDITYTCAVTDSAGNTVTDVGWYNGSGVSDPAGTGELTGTFIANVKGDRQLTCSIPLSAFGPDGTEAVTVTAAATAPYAAALTARVTLAGGSSGVRLVVTDRGETFGAVSVTLFHTGDITDGECAGTLTWPAGEDLELVPDPTWETEMNVRGLESGEGTVTVPPGGAISVVFLKKDANKIYNESNFAFIVSP